MNKREEFERIYKKCLAKARYKYLAYRMAEHEFRSLYGFTMYSNFNSYQTTAARKKK